jgi:DNA-binding transcriptional LysR family regulator
MVLVTQPGARQHGAVSSDELRRTPLVLGDGLRAAMDALLAGRGIELNVEMEVNDHETMRLMVQRGAAASVLPYSSVARECERGLLAAHRLTDSGVFRTLALGVRASRTASLAREAVVRTITRDGS